MTFTPRQMTPTAISQTNPVRVAVTAHGLTTGQRVRASDFTSSLDPVDSGMKELNNRLFYINVIDADNFDLYMVISQFDRRVDGTSYTAFTGSGTPAFVLTGPELDVKNTA